MVLVASEHSDWFWIFYIIRSIKKRPTQLCKLRLSKYFNCKNVIVIQQSEIFSSNYVHRVNAVKYGKTTLKFRSTFEYDPILDYINNKNLQWLKYAIIVLRKNEKMRHHVCAVLIVKFCFRNYWAASEKFSFKISSLVKTFFW